MRPDKLPDRVEDKVNEADNCPTERQAGDNLQGLYQWNKKVNSLDVPFFSFYIWVNLITVTQLSST